jgi:hypothetical protein
MDNASFYNATQGCCRAERIAASAGAFGHLRGCSAQLAQGGIRDGGAALRQNGMDTCPRNYARPNLAGWQGAGGLRCGAALQLRCLHRELSREGLGTKSAAESCRQLGSQRAATAYRKVLLAAHPERPEGQPPTPADERASRQARSAADDPVGCWRVLNARARVREPLPAAEGRAELAEAGGRRVGVGGGVCGAQVGEVEGAGCGAGVEGRHIFISCERPGRRDGCRL